LALSVVLEMLSINPYSGTISNFVNSIAEIAHIFLNMEAQTLEAIADLSIIGGQSIIGLMRQERNQAKLQLVGSTSIIIDPNCRTISSNFIS